jgi:sigma-B regulation protein RsbU (phosphoserine phosphatase)
VTVFLGIFEVTSGKLEYSNAGHPPPILVNPARPGESPLLEATGPPLGLFSQGIWQQKSLEFGSGDLLALYTDGIPEAEGEQGAFYGLERLVDQVCRRAAEPLEALKSALLEDVQQFMGGAPLLDDVALLLLRRGDALPLA